MSIKVPPVTGKTPQQVALLMREKLKHMAQAGTGLGKKYDLDGVEARRLQYAKDVDVHSMHINGTISELKSAVSRRKPSEMRAIIARLEDQLYSMRAALSKERGRASRLYEYGKTSGGGGVASTAEIKELYALVQALPTVENIPVGKVENSLRAIAAIVKAHYGMLEADVSGAPHEGGEIALVDALMKLVQEKTAAKSLIAALDETNNPQEVVAGDTA